MEHESHDRRPSHLEFLETSSTEHPSFLKRIKQHLGERWFDWVSVFGIGIILVYLGLSTDEKVGRLLEIATSWANSHFVEVPSPGQPSISIAPPVHQATVPLQFTRATPVYVDSAYSASDSQIAANRLRDALGGEFSSIVTNKSAAKILIKVRDITHPECTGIQPMSCPVILHVIGEYANGGQFFDQSFRGNENETSSTLGQDGYDEAITDAVAKAASYILSRANN